MRYFRAKTDVCLWGAEDMPQLNETFFVAKWAKVVDKRRNYVVRNWHLDRFFVSRRHGFRLLAENVGRVAALYLPKQ